jgi:uncharacterized membrane protein
MSIPCSRYFLMMMIMIIIIIITIIIIMYYYLFIYLSEISDMKTKAFSNNLFGINRSVLMRPNVLQHQYRDTGSQ